MNGAYLHLLTNHIPVVGVPVGFFLLLAGLGRKSRDLIQAGFVTLILMALVTIVVDQSGGPAAHIARNIPGVERVRIHDHAEAADWAVGTIYGLGALALVGFFLSLRGDPPKALTILVLVGSLFASVVFARVAHLGGLIRHPEIDPNNPPPGAMMMMTGPAPTNH